VRLFKHFAELRQEGLGEPQPMEIEHHRIAIKQAHHDAFAVRGRHRADAQVQFLALHAQHDAAVLRQPALGDVQPRHDLDAADHCSGQIDRRAFAFDQHAVDAVTHLQAILERFDMDIRGAQFHRPLDHQVDQPDHRRFGGQIAQVFDVVDRSAFAVGGFDDRAHRAAALAEPALDQIINLRAQAHVQAHRQPHGQLHGVGRVGILRVGQPQIQHVVMQRQRADMELFEETQRQRQPIQQRFGRRLGHRLGIQQRQAEHLGTGLCMVALGDQAQADQQTQQAATGFAVQRTRAGQVAVLEPTFLQQHPDDAGFSGGFCSGIRGDRVQESSPGNRCDFSSSPRPYAGLHDVQM